MNDIKYFLVAEVDGEMVFNAEYPDTNLLTEKLYKAEMCVERKLEELSNG